MIMVTGMHRSGTSVVAQLLDACGFDLGGPLLQESVSDNSDGYWEHAEVVAINEGLLDALDRTWHGGHGASALPEGWLSWPQTLEAERQLKIIVQRELTQYSTWVVKDPRFCRLMPLWGRVLKALAVSYQVVHCIRHPKEVTASLATRQDMPTELAYNIWQVHQTDLLRDCRDVMRIPVSYDALMREPEAVLTELLSALRAPRTQDLVRKAAAKVKPAYRHHRTIDSDQAVPVHLSKVQTCHALYVQLLSGQAPDLFPDSATVVEHGSVQIVMRTLDRPAFLSRAIRDVLAQRYQDWQLWIVNDGGATEPLDATVAPYLFALRGRCVVRHLISNVGMEAASNLAIREGQSTFIVIHDDDDRWHPDFLVNMTQALASSGRVGMVSATWVVHEHTAKDKIVFDRSELFEPGVSEPSLESLLIRNRFPPIAFLYRRSAIEQVGLYREDLPVLGDWEFNLRFAKTFDLAFLDDRLAYWHKRPPSDPRPNSNNQTHLRVDLRLRSEQRMPMQRRQGLVDFPMFRARDLHGPHVHAMATSRRAQELTSPLGHFNLNRLADTWVGTSEDPFWIFKFSQPLTSDGLYIVSFNLEGLQNGEAPQLFLAPDIKFTLAHSIRLPHDASGHYHLLVSPKVTLTHLRLDPFDRPGGVKLKGLRVNPIPAPSLNAVEIPTHWIPRLPDFLCIGAQRSGTTWLHQNLAAHPELCLPFVKEIHYFDEVHAENQTSWRAFRERFLSQILESRATEKDAGTVSWALNFAAYRQIDDHWYASLFSDAPKHQQVGDFTPAYATLPRQGVQHVHLLMPKAKIIFLLRDPVQRAISGAVHELVRVQGVINPSLAQLMAQVELEQNRRRSDYRQTFAEWDTFYPASQIGVFFFDDISEDPRGLLAKVCDFLGLPHAPSVMDHPEKIHNANLFVLPDADQQRLVKHLSKELLPQLHWLAARFGGHASRWLRDAELVMGASKPLPSGSSVTEMPT
jgi:GT2 family glycosyltransferase/LPS sulfotransferase NodH